MKNFEEIPSNELRLYLTDHGLAPSYTLNTKCRRFTFALQTETKLLCSDEVTFDLINTGVGFENATLFDAFGDEWFTISLGGNYYEINIWFDDITEEFSASIFPVEEDEDGYVDTDTSQLIHRIEPSQVIITQNENASI